jgi:outer membrane biosynthesis protein TonB
MTRSLIYSLSFHAIMILLTVLSLPFMIRQPVDLPPIISVELIQISDKTNIPYAPKARKVLEKVKEEEKRVVSEQAPPSAKAKEKPDRIPLPKKQDEKKELIKKKQNPKEIKPEIRQASEFEKKEIIDTNQIAALIDKAKEENSTKVEKNKNKLTQSNVKNSFASGLTLSEEDALRAQIFGCWTVPLGLPYDEDLLVRVKLELKQDGTINKSEILDHERMNKPGQKFYKILAESALRAVRICQPLRVPQTGYEKWKTIQLNFDPTEMLKG